MGVTLGEILSELLPVGWFKRALVQQFLDVAVAPIQPQRQASQHSPYHFSHRRLASLASSFFVAAPNRGKKYSILLWLPPPPPSFFLFVAVECQQHRNGAHEAAIVIFNYNFYQTVINTNEWPGL